jgi:capsule polysaccharide export protein KpsE/RkpR
MEKRLLSTDSTIHAIADTIEKFSRRTMIFSPTDQAASITKALSDLKAEAMKYDIMHEYYKSIYGENDYMTQAIQNIKNQSELKVKESTNNPGFAGNFAIKDAAEEGIEFLRLYTEFETFSKVKAFILPMMEQTKMDEAKKIKNLIIVDRAVAPEKKDKPKRSLIVAGTFLGSFIFSFFIVLMFYTVRSLKTKVKAINNG